VTLRVKATLKYSPTYKGGNISHNAPSAHCRPRGCTNTCARRLRAYTDSLAVLGKREITKRRNGVISLKHGSFLPAVLFSEITRDFFVRDTLREGRTADELDIMDSLDSCRDSVPPPMTSIVIPKEQVFGDDVRLLLLYEKETFYDEIQVSVVKWSSSPAEERPRREPMKMLRWRKENPTIRSGTSYF